jgi:hypothetical protein
MTKEQIALEFAKLCPPDMPSHQVREFVTIRMEAVAAACEPKKAERSEVKGLDGSNVLSRVESILSTEQSMDKTVRQLVCLLSNVLREAGFPNEADEVYKRVYGWSAVDPNTRSAVGPSKEKS